MRLVWGVVDHPNFILASLYTSMTMTFLCILTIYARWGTAKHQTPTFSSIKAHSTSSSMTSILTSKNRHEPDKTITRKNRLQWVSRLTTPATKSHITTWYRKRSKKFLLPTEDAQTWLLLKLWMLPTVPCLVLSLGIRSVHIWFIKASRLMSPWTTLYKWKLEAYLISTLRKELMRPSFVCLFLTGCYNAFPQFHRKKPSIKT